MQLTSPTGHKKIVLQDEESLDIFLEDFENGSREFTLEVELLGKKSECKITGRARAKNQDKKIWRVSQVYLGEEQVGDIDLRGTAEDDAFLQFDGKAELAQSSTEAEANVTEKIMLFGNGKGRSLPVLTVKTDQVKAASHGATVAPVSASHLLYLQSRGIAKNQAQEMLKTGFLK